MILDQGLGRGDAEVCSSVRLSEYLSPLSCVLRHVGLGVPAAAVIGAVIYSKVNSVVLSFFCATLYTLSS